MSNTPVTIITGGGGMGLATAKLMGAGSRIVLCDLDSDALNDAATSLRSAGIDARAAACDITDTSAIHDAFGMAADLGPINAVVHTAGLSPLMGSAESIVRVNALGTVNITRAALKVASPNLAVVLVASMAGHLLPRAAVPRRHYKLAESDLDRFVTKLTKAASLGPKSTHSSSAYSISKNFVIWHAQDQARAFGKHGSRIVSVSPGSFDTTMGRLEIQNGAERILQFAALPRFGQPEEIAALIAFCASDKASYLTGTDILCDGGTVAGVSVRDLVRVVFNR